MERFRKEEKKRKSRGNREGEKLEVGKKRSMKKEKKKQKINKIKENENHSIRRKSSLWRGVCVCVCARARACVRANECRRMSGWACPYVSLN